MVIGLWMKKVAYYLSLNNTAAVFTFSCNCNFCEERSTGGMGRLQLTADDFWFYFLIDFYYVKKLSNQTDSQKENKQKFLMTLVTYLGAVCFLLGNGKTEKLKETKMVKFMQRKKERTASDFKYDWIIK